MDLYIIVSALLVISYFLGSIPFGIFFARVKGVKNLQQLGSGNIGATNVIRNAGLLMGILTFICDGAKGIIPIMIAQSYSLDSVYVHAIALSAFLGHIFPVWLKFKGGKGVAIAFFIITYLDFATGMVFLASFLSMALISRFVSLSSSFAIVVATVASFKTEIDWDFTVLMLIFAVLIIFRHKDNFNKILQGKEERIKFPKF